MEGFSAQFAFTLTRLRCCLSSSFFFSLLSQFQISVCRLFAAGYVFYLWCCVSSQWCCFSLSALCSSKCLWPEAVAECSFIFSSHPSSLARSLSPALLLLVCPPSLVLKIDTPSISSTPALLLADCIDGEQKTEAEKEGKEKKRGLKNRRGKWDGESERGKIRDEEERNRKTQAGK